MGCSNSKATTASGILDDRTAIAGGGGSGAASPRRPSLRIGGGAAHSGNRRTSSSGNKSHSNDSDDPLSIPRRERIDSWAAASHDLDPTGGGGSATAATTTTTTATMNGGLTNAGKDGAAAVSLLGPRTASHESSYDGGDGNNASLLPPHPSTGTVTSISPQRTPVPPPLLLPPSVEVQWRTLYEHLSPLLCDPLDAHAVLDAALSHLVTLSPAETQLLRRRIRFAVSRIEDPAYVSPLAHASLTDPTSNPLVIPVKRRKEAKLLVERQRLINDALLSLLLPPPSALIMNNWHVLGCHLSETLWDRVAASALESSQLCQQQEKQQAQQQAQAQAQVPQPSPSRGGSSTAGAAPDLPVFVPKPSLIVPVAEPPLTPNDVPPGMTFTALAALLSVGLRGSRVQQLHLLFYLLVDNLEAFLRNHPGGGVPVFLLEVDQPVLLSLASLTHYHYFGNTYLPSSSSGDGGQSARPMPAASSFVESKSRPAPRLSVSHLVHVLRAAGSAESSPGAPDTDESGTGHTYPALLNGTSGGASKHLAHSSSATSPIGAPLLQRMTAPDASTALPLSKSAPLLDAADALGRTVRAATSHPHDPTSTASANNYNSPARLLWTIQQFDHWASNALADDSLVQSLLWRLLGHGLLPSPEWEKLLVQEAWSEYVDRYSQQLWPASTASPSHADGGDSSTVPSSSPSRGFLSNSIFSTVLEYSAATCGAGTATASNGDADRNPHDRPHSQDGAAAAGGSSSPLALRAVWGGLGGLDGGGGLGHGVLYCIDKNWWDEWASYVQWSWAGDPVAGSSDLPGSSGRRRRRRPAELSTERLLERNWSVPGGVHGSYELMKNGLHHNVDYVLVPPSVWDVLYELYGGGPPLPRMIRPNNARKLGTDFGRTSTEMTGDSSSHHTSYHKMAQELDNLVHSVEPTRVPPLPDSLSVVLHPWLVHVHLCDPTAPYRRGEVGLLSIRVMAAPDQPLWRLFAEAIARLPLHAYKAFVNGRGKARLWKRTDRSPGPMKAPLSRYGPWNPLCKSREAILPILKGSNASRYLARDYDELVENWKTYTDNASVEGCGLADNDHLMLEFATVGKTGELLWPRDAAAKAGRVRRLAEEDMSFRQTLQGVDEAGSLLLKPAELVGMDVDGLDASGRWYPVKILEVDIFDEDTDDELAIENDAAASGRAERHVTRKKVRVDFTEHGGREEWIDVESDRLAVHGRFTSDAERQNGAADDADKANPSAGTDIVATKPKLAMPTARKNSGINDADNGKICIFPGFGACGLTNLGNTCYVNSAIQCISYLPLLRSYLLSSQYKTNGDLNRDNPLGTGGKLLEEFVELLRAMWSGRLGEKSPNRFRAHLGKVKDQFSGADQQDSQEFLSYILDILHEDCNKVRKKPYVEALEDDWVAKTALHRVADESWRRFLRRNRSVMTDVAMGQVLNTVTCPVCQYSSRIFDPFNLLSLPLPHHAGDLHFKCIVYRRSTSMNCPWVLNKPRKGQKTPYRFVQRAASAPSGPPSDEHSAEQYLVTINRLAYSGDLRLQIQNESGIPASQLKLCRVEEVAVDKNEGGITSSVVSSVLKITPLTDKDVPCSSLVKKRGPGEDALAALFTTVVAFETTLRPRSVPPKKEDVEAPEDTADEEDELDFDDENVSTTPREQSLIKRYLDVYGDDQECRVLDTNPVIIAKAVSRSLWPKTEDELKLGLRVDARDHRGSWFPGNVVEIIEDEVNGGDADTGEAVPIRTKKARVHFDNFSTKWDEMYSIDHFLSGSVRPLYSHAAPRPKPTEFLVQNRHTDRTTGQSVVFGQMFYVQCMNDWSNARAGAHILAQSSRFLCHEADEMSAADVASDPEAVERDRLVRRLYEKTQTTISDLIDLLVDCDREYVLLALGLSEHNKVDEKFQPFRNSAFDPTQLSSLVMKKVAALLARLPFELRVCTTDAVVDKASGSSPSSTDSVPEEIQFPFSLIRTIGNYLNARHAIVLHWKEPPVDKKTGITKYSLDAPVMYVSPKVEIDKASADALSKVVGAPAVAPGAAPDAASANGVDLGVCLTKFCKIQHLKLTDNWKCPKCEKVREGEQRMALWRLPDLLTFHFKRFMSARPGDKIFTRVSFPLTGLDMSEWCHTEDGVAASASSDVYDLIGVVNHYGQMGSGHYVAMCKATPCSGDGREEVAYGFNGVGAQDDALSLLPGPSNNRGVGAVGGGGHASSVFVGPRDVELISQALADELASSSTSAGPSSLTATTIASGWRGALGRGFPTKLTGDTAAAASAAAAASPAAGGGGGNGAGSFSALAPSPSHNNGGGGNNSNANAHGAASSAAAANVLSTLTTPSKMGAALSSQAASESAEPLWLQFDDLNDAVEPVPPRHVVSEAAYVLFYRRRRMTPSNLTKYGTLT